MSKKMISIYIKLFIYFILVLPSGSLTSAISSKCKENLTLNSQCFLQNDSSELKTNCTKFFLYDSLMFANSLMKTIPSYFFAQLCIRTLTINYVGLESFSNTSFADMEMIYELYINGNYIETIDDIVYSLNAKYLKTMDFTDNYIKILPAKFPPSYANLTKLVLNNNAIEIIPDGVFENLISLLYLELDDNEILAIGNSNFIGLKCLTNLYLGENFISSIGPDSFKDSKELYHITLKGNLISYLNGTFYNQQKLT